MDSSSTLPLAGFGLIALLSALAVVLARRPVYAVLALLLHSLTIALLFAILGAGMVSMGQLLIYSGAIVVLFLFVVTLLPRGGIELAPTNARIGGALVAAAALIAAFGAALAGAFPQPAATPIDLADIGRSLFGPLLVAMELTAPLLLVAIVAGVAIWRRHEPRSARKSIPKGATGPRRLVMHR